MYFSFDLEIFIYKPADSYIHNFVNSTYFLFRPIDFALDLHLQI